MKFFISLMLLMTVFALGMKAQMSIYKKTLNDELQKKVSEKNQEFSEILNNIHLSEFRSRVNTTVYIQSKTKTR